MAQRNHAKELMRSKGIHQSIIDVLDIGPVDTIRLTAEMETSVQPPHNWRELAQRWIGKNGGHPRVFLIGDSMHPMTREISRVCLCNILSLELTRELSWSRDGRKPGLPLF